MGHKCAMKVCFCWKSSSNLDIILLSSLTGLIIHHYFVRASEIAFSGLLPEDKLLFFPFLAFYIDSISR